MPPKKPSPAKVPASKSPPKAVSKGTGVKKTSSNTAAGTKGKPVTKGKVTTKPNPAPKQKVWTKEDEAARKIQTKARQFLARKKLERIKKEKQEYEELMDKLEREAFAKLVKMEQEQAEKERQKEEEERRKKKEAAQRRKRMLEAAFDGDNDEILCILKEVSDADDKAGLGNDVIGRALRNKHLLDMVDCEDANNNTPLSEAGSGGHVETVRLLTERGADPNSKGQFQRTPLYRAAFAGHLEACEYLLQNGADPRLYASDGQIPEHVASVGGVKELLTSWDISQTEMLLEKLESAKERRAEEERKRRAAEQSKLEDQIAEADKEYKSKQKQLDRAYCELEKRIREHDEAVGGGFDRPELTLAAVHDAEAEVEIIKIDCEKARDKLAQVKLSLREQQRQGMASLGEDELPGVKVMVRELDDVLLRDVGNKITDSGKWPLIIDPSGQAATFLRYRDTNYLQTLSPSNMHPDKVRLAILGAIRFGKPLVLDMMEVDMFDTVSDRIDEIQPGLMDSIMDKTVLEEERYLKLVKKEDGEDYVKTKFNDLRTKNFKLFIITKNPFPPESLVERTYLLRIFMPST